MKLIIDNKIPYIRTHAERLGECTFLPGTAITAADVRDADVLIVRTRTKVNRQLLEGSRVQLVVSATIGFDHLDTEYLEEAGIAWKNCPGCNAGSVAQYVESALLVLHQQGIVNLRSGPTVGVVGVGHVGSRVAATCAALGCSVLRNDPPRQQREGGFFVSLAQIQAEADIITFHTPLTKEGPFATHGMAGSGFFEGLQRQPVILNTARGGVVDEGALEQALDAGRVRASVIDTWENEPNISRSLLQKTLVGTPHIAGYSADGKANATRMALEAVAHHFGLHETFCVEPPCLSPDVELSADPLERKLQLYNPMRDSEALKAHPERFEWFRENYPLRREA
ncbi:MAG: 4-phosphoerythronate dehydrogenase [Bacteroidaceae bacterium]|nr:4-phosphoerythronate dehydrogenase [Bacteroidaceae bacterium]